MAIQGAIYAAAGAEPAPIRFRGHDSELAIHQLTDRTAQIVLAPIDENNGKTRVAPPSSVVVEQQPRLLMRCRSLGGPAVVTAGNLRIEITPDPLTVSIGKSSGEVVQRLTFGSGNDEGVSFRAAAPVLGMGEGAQQFDRRGAVYTMKDGWGAWERPTYGSWVAVPLVVGTDGWALFVHHPLGQFDLRTAEATFTPWPDQVDSPLEIYLIAWEEPADVLREYSGLVGRTPLPPKWALGFMQSHRTLSGPDEVLRVARTYRAKKLPCDALIYLGTGYCPAGWNTGHASLEFNPATFDKPAEIIRELHELNFKVVLHKNAPPRQLAGLEVTRVDAATDSTNRSSRRGRRQNSTISEYWARHRAAFELGVDGWWPDDGDELDRESRLARHRMYYEGPLLDRPNARPWNLQRTGYAGVQRYGGWIWSGDIDSRWQTLSAQVAVGLNHSLSLSPYWGTDVGGFYPTRELTGELYVRWFQFGAFCPSFRAHGRTWHLRLPWGWNTGEFGPLEHDDQPDANELHNAEVEPICRKYLELRYQLLPYTYTLCREAHDAGLPLMRALWLHYPNDSRAIARGDEYLWGRDILVAPVTVMAASQRTLYLPEGDWYDFWTAERHAGGRELKRPVDLATMPLYVRAGAILPLDPVRQYTDQPSDKPTTIRVYPGRDGEFRWYDDDGKSLEYLADKYAWVRLRWSDAEHRLAIVPDGDGTFPARSRELAVELISTGERQTVRYAGRPLEVTFKQDGVRKVGAVPQGLRDSLRLDPYYAKHVDAGGLPVLSSAKVSDAALLEAAHIVDRMLASRPDIRQTLVKRRVRIVVMAPTEMTTDVPEQRDMTPKDYWNRRARGLGGRVCSCGEENLLKMAGDRYAAENILIHEFSHTIHNFGLRTVDPTFDERLKKAYQRAGEQGLWNDTYAATNHEEYWAEGVQDYFDCNASSPRKGVHNHVDTRDELQGYDPALFALIDEVFKGTQWRYVRFDQRHYPGERAAGNEEAAPARQASP